MKLQNKQLELFDDTYPERVDKLFKDLQVLVQNYKHATLLFEISLGAENSSFLRLKMAILELGEFMKLLLPVGKLIKITKHEAVDKLTHYEPYYVPIDALLPLDLYYLLLDLDLRSKKLLGHNKGLIEDRGLQGQIYLDEFMKYTSQAMANLKKKYGDGF